MDKLTNQIEELVLDEKNIKKYGQYFTMDKSLQNKLLSFVQQKDAKFLEPSCGRGDLVNCMLKKFPDRTFDAYEIDPNIKMLPCMENVTFDNFLIRDIDEKYLCIVGNPPYCKGKTNTYVKFIQKCVDMIEPSGELIFIIPSTFFGLTSASKLLDKMVSSGSFTDIYHPHDESLFKGASIDVVIFRWEKDLQNDLVMYNDEKKYICNINGVITFHDEPIDYKNTSTIGDNFTAHVGMVSGCKKIFNQSFGNINVLCGDEKRNKFIFIDELPYNDEIDNHLLEHKEKLLSRKIKKFNETNWFKWGAPRNLSTILEHEGKDCIYLYNLTRKESIAFVGKVEYFGGSLIMLLPKNDNTVLVNIVDELNSTKFKSHHTFSGRFKIGQKQLLSSIINV